MSMWMVWQHWSPALYLEGAGKILEQQREDDDVEQVSGQRLDRAAQRVEEALLRVGRHLQRLVRLQRQEVAVVNTLQHQSQKHV